MAVKTMQQISIETVIDIALQAAAKVRQIYQSEDFDVTIKTDHSPLTAADTAANKIITEGLQKSFPEVPVLSEENKITPYETRQNWQRFWLVDPLDGTKEFIKRNGEFTVNIALIENNLPILGVIAIPAREEIWFGDKNGSFKRNIPANETVRLPYTKTSTVTAAISRSHSSDKEQKALQKLGVNKTIAAGSSLKFCLVAAGEADYYLRLGNTYEWDTAAGHAIVRYTKNKNLPIKEELKYNTKTLLNSSFLVFSGHVSDYRK
jgi:3'(2'), 5'-bisphosphate nucleotidase